MFWKKSEPIEDNEYNQYIEPALNIVVDELNTCGSFICNNDIGDSRTRKEYDLIKHEWDYRKNDKLIINSTISGTYTIDGRYRNMTELKFYLRMIIVCDDNNFATMYIEFNKEKNKRMKSKITVYSHDTYRQNQIILQPSRIILNNVTKIKKTLKLWMKYYNSWDHDVWFYGHEPRI